MKAEKERIKEVLSKSKDEIIEKELKRKLKEIDKKINKS